MQDTNANFSVDYESFKEMGQDNKDEEIEIDDLSLDEEEN